jgi:uncharacterized protein (TIGR02757 family)
MRVCQETPLRERLAADPVQFPRAFYEAGRCKAETEAVALFSAMLSYGRVDLFTRVIRTVLDGCHRHFLDLISRRVRLEQPWPNYRLSTSTEVCAFAMAIGRTLQKNPTLESVFQQGFTKTNKVEDGIAALRGELLRHAPQAIAKAPGFLHFLPDPAKGGALKRWNMFLRWMARPDDGIDLGIWSAVPTSSLIIPLDRHISRIARNLGFTSRKTDDLKTALEVTSALKMFDAKDPVRFDFALCHLGIRQACDHGKNAELCVSCSLAAVCVKGASRS